MKDLHSNIKLVQTLDPATVTGTSDVNGATVDRQGFDSVEHIVLFGESGDTLSGSVYFDVTIQESDDDSTWTDVTTAADVVGATPDANGVWTTIDAAAEDDTLYRIGYVGGKRYSRLQVELTGTHTNGTPIAACAVLGHADQAPTSD
jgi:hypothetical protein